MNFDIKKIFENFSHLHSIISMVSVLIGKGDAVPSDDFGKFSGLAGVFGKKDEAKLFVSLLNKDITAGEREAIVDFILWYQGQYGNGPVSWVLVWWWSNAWRTFVTVNLYMNPEKTGTNKIEWTDADRKKHTISKDVFEGGGAYTVMFLKHIAELIGVPATEEGYKRVLHEFEAIGVPRLPNPETVRWVDGMIPSAPELREKIAHLTDTLSQKSTGGKTFVLEKINAADAALRDRYQLLRRAEETLPWYRRAFRW